MKKIKRKKIRIFILKMIHRCPLAFMLVASTLILSLSAVASHFIIGSDLQVSLEHPLFASILVREDHPNDKEDNGINEEDIAVSADIKKNTELESNGENESESNVENTSNSSDEKETGYPTKFVDKKKVKEKSPYYDDPGKIALTTEYPYVEVNETYFDDALFIGDSRIEGLKAYSGLTNATFYCKQGITVYKLMSEKIVKMKIDGKKKEVSITKALKQKKFSKIYIMIGINELGYRTTEDFKKQYQSVINELRKLQPDAKIFIMGIMKVTDEYSKENEVFNNENINAKNVAIAEIADGIDVFYLDFNPEITDSKNGIKKKYTWDGIHLKAEYYSIWVDFLKKHGM